MEDNFSSPPNTYVLLPQPGWLFAVAADIYFLFFKTCLFQSPKVVSTLTAFRNTAKVVPNYSMSCFHSSRKVNSHRDPNPMLLPIYIVLLGSELINKLCNPEKPVSLGLVITTIFFLRKEICHPEMPVCLISVIIIMVFFWEHEFLQHYIASNFGIIYLHQVQLKRHASVLAQQMKIFKTFIWLRLKDKLMQVLQKKRKYVWMPNYVLKGKAKILTLSEVQGPDPWKVSRSKTVVFSQKVSDESNHWYSPMLLTLVCFKE